MRAEGQQRDLAALLHDPALADLQRRPALGHLDADALAAGIAEREGPSSCGGGGDHVHKIGLVAGGHHTMPGRLPR
jgi:hypothetical protein